MAHALELLDDEVRVANDVVLRVQLLRRRVVVRLSVDEVAVPGVSDQPDRTKNTAYPASRFLMAIVMVKGLFAAMLPMLGGLTNFAAGYNHG